MTVRLLAPMPQIHVELPEVLRPLAADAGVVAAQGETVAEALADLGRRHPLLVQRVLSRGGAPRPHVNLFLNQDDLRRAQGLATPLRDGDRLQVIASVSGG
jgi:molybdopterin converting factor small subunit